MFEAFYQGGSYFGYRLGYRCLRDVEDLATFLHIYISCHLVGDMGDRLDYAIDG